MKFKTVDQHHLDALYDLLRAHGLLEGNSSNDTAGNSSRDGNSSNHEVGTSSLGGNSCKDKAGDGSLFDDEEIKDLSLVWHRLDPWPDTCNGIRELNKQYQTSTLTNGNLALINDMVKHSDMGFTHVLSAEMFNSYKPNPAVYLGAAARIDLKPAQCAMVAAHLDDLQAAQRCGFSTIYVERSREERYPELGEHEGLVDLWVHQGEGGFETVARRLLDLNGSSS